MNPPRPPFSERRANLRELARALALRQRLTGRPELSVADILETILDLGYRKPESVAEKEAA